MPYFRNQRVHYVDHFRAAVSYQLCGYSVYSGGFVPFLGWNCFGYFPHRWTLSSLSFSIPTLGGVPVVTLAGTLKFNSCWKYLCHLSLIFSRFPIIFPVSFLHRFVFGLNPVLICFITEYAVFVLLFLMFSSIFFNKLLRCILFLCLQSLSDSLLCCL